MMVTKRKLLVLVILMVFAVRIYWVSRIQSIPISLVRLQSNKRSNLSYLPMRAITTHRILHLNNTQPVGSSVKKFLSGDLTCFEVEGLALCSWSVRRLAQLRSLHQPGQCLRCKSSDSREPVAVKKLAALT